MEQQQVEHVRAQDLFPHVARQRFSRGDGLLVGPCRLLLVRQHLRQPSSREGGRQTPRRSAGLALACFCFFIHSDRSSVQSVAAAVGPIRTYAQVIPAPPSAPRPDHEASLANYATDSIPVFGLGSSPRPSPMPTPRRQRSLGSG